MHVQRRQKLLSRLGDGLLVLPTARQTLRNGDVHFDFRPGSDLFYLTGFSEPDTVLVAWRSSATRHRSVLFVPPRDRQREIWDGPRAGTKGAVRDFDVDEAHPIGELWTRLPDLLDPHDRVFCTLFADAAFDQRLKAAFRERATRRRRANPPAHPRLEDPRPAIAEMRLIKDAAEIRTMAEAARISIQGHMLAMQAAAPGRKEYEVQAVLEAEFRRLGARRTGYESIVASGPNACVLHYVRNDRAMRAGELLLVDAGAEFGHYTADITRTFPVSGAFTGPQAAVYRAVLRAAKAGIRAVKPGARWDAPHRACLRTITKGLIELGILKGSAKKLLEAGACRRWFMHGTSHWLGMDVHDTGAYETADGKPARLHPGMVMTVEPGLYFAPRDQTVPKEFRGIGVRIEDDVLVTRDGHRNLTGAMPREIDEIEALCRGR